jgi:hypothetical protein
MRGPPRTSRTGRQARGRGVLCSVMSMAATPRVPVRSVPTAGGFGSASGPRRSTHRCDRARTTGRAQR